MNLSTTYLPIPLSSPSVFEEQIHQEKTFMAHFRNVGTDAHPEAPGVFPEPLSIPVDVKIRSHYSALADMGKRFEKTGATVVCSTSAMLKNGPAKITAAKKRREGWLKENSYKNVDELCGCMQREYVDNPKFFERANYSKLLEIYA